MPDDLPEPSDADLADVRRLLRAARADQPMPADVVTRLDDTLAELVAERSAVSAPAGGVSRAGDAPNGAPDELAARRARRRRFVGGAGLVAAAAVVAVGFLGQIVSDDEPDGSAADSGSSSETMNEAPPEAAPDAAAPTEAPDPRAEGEAPSANLGLPLSEQDQRAVTYALAQLSMLSEGKDWSYSSERGAAQRRLSTVKRCGGWDARSTLIDLGPELNGDNTSTDLVLALEPPRSDGTRSAHVVDCQADPPVSLQSVDVPAFD